MRESWGVDRAENPQFEGAKAPSPACREQVRGEAEEKQALEQGIRAKARGWACGLRRA